MQALAAKRINPYYQPDTLTIMVDAIMKYVKHQPTSVKTFYDLKKC
jgi:hypothetical protein